MKTAIENSIIDDFKRYYENHKATDLTKLEDIYAPTIVFKDPLHTFRGLTALRDYMSAMYENITECRFEYLDQLVGDNTAYIKWNMHFRHPRFGNKLISVRGVSQIQFNDKITFHEDIYDLGEMVYEHLPVLGGITRWVKKRLSSLGYNA